MLQVLMVCPLGWRNEKPSHPAAVSRSRCDIWGLLAAELCRERRSRSHLFQLPRACHILQGEVTASFCMDQVLGSLWRSSCCMAPCRRLLLRVPADPPWNVAQ